MNTSGTPKRTFETVYDKPNSASLALHHPKYKGRADRLDLITNRMVGFKAAIGDKNFTICDLSETGFSYAERVPVKRNLSFKQVKVKVDQIAVSNYGKRLKCVCFFEGEVERGGVETLGTIKNHNLFLILSIDEIKRAVTTYLQSKAIRRSHDPEGFFQKLDLITSKSDKLKQDGCSEATLAIVMNTTFQNLILEIGAPVEIFDTLYQGYINKPVYVKYGVAIENKKEAAKLVKFARLKNASVLANETNNKDQVLTEQLGLIKRLNDAFSFKSFVMIVWKNCLKEFNLDLNQELPKIEKEKIAQKMKEEKQRFDGHLEKMADPDFIEDDYPGLEGYLCDGLYWHLIEKDKKYFDREVIKKEIRRLVEESYQRCISSLKATC